jgi:hypothetical protein
MKRGILFILILIAFLGFVQPYFEVGNISHELSRTIYGKNTNVLGWINLSLDSENSISLFESNNGNISLLDLLKLNINLVEGRDYNCSSVECYKDYLVTNSETTKSFSLNTGQSKLLGIFFTQKINGITSINFNITSDAPSFCQNQIEIDILADGIIERGNTKSSTGECPYLKDYGCFDSNEPSDYVQIATFPSRHCEEIEFPAAPGFDIGANIQLNGDVQNITMGIYNSVHELIEDTACLLQKENGEVSCSIEYGIFEPKNHTVCISSTGTSLAKIKSYENEDSCGFYYASGSENKGDFEIFMQPKKFGAVGEIEINNSRIGEEKALNVLVQDYLFEKYGYGNNIPCDEKTCYVPILINSNLNQEITIQDIEIQYESYLGTQTKEELYDFEETTSTINSDFIKIIFDSANFTTRNGPGNMTFRLDFADDRIFSELISIRELPNVERITPNTVAQGFATELTAVLDSDINVSKFFWSFGDLTDATTTTNKVTKRYNQTGTYQIQIRVGEGNESSLSSFNIEVVSPEAKIETTLNEFQLNLVEIKSNIDSFDYISQLLLEKSLNLSHMEDTLTELQKDFAQATTELEYLEIIEKLSILNIPPTIIKTKSANAITFSASDSSINLEALRIFAGGEYDSSQIEQYKNAINSWVQTSMNAKITYHEFSTTTDLILNVFKLELSEKDFTDRGYIIIQNLEELSFDKNYSQKEDSGHYSIEFSSLPQTISFSTTEEIDFANLPLFISTDLNSLSVLTDIQDSEKEPFKLIILILILFLLVIVGVGVYVGLQIWYKKKYESYLFKNKNNMYNLINYINNEKKQGKLDQEITKNLKKVGWNSEQITYVTKKYAGKRTGMYELSLGKIFKRKIIPTTPGQNPSTIPKTPEQTQKRFFPENKFKRY